MLLFARTSSDFSLLANDIVVLLYGYDLYWTALMCTNSCDALSCQAYNTPFWHKTSWCSALVPPSTLALSCIRQLLWFHHHQ